MFLSHQPVEVEKGESERAGLREVAPKHQRSYFWAWGVLHRPGAGLAQLVWFPAQQNKNLNSLISLLTSRVEPDEEFSHLIVHPNQNGMGYSHKPVLNPGNKGRNMSPGWSKEIAQTQANSGGRGKDFLSNVPASIEIANILHHTTQACHAPSLTRDGTAKISTGL